MSLTRHIDLNSLCDHRTSAIAPGSGCSRSRRSAGAVRLRRPTAAGRWRPHWRGTFMRLKSTAIVGMVAASALLLAACGSSSSSSGTTTSAAASGSSAASGSAGGGAAAGATGKVGVILPDTKSSARWETQDRPALEKAFQAAGVEFDIQNANGDKAAMATIADQMIANGATVLAIVNLDNESGAAIETKAASQGV